MSRACKIHNKGRRFVYLSAGDYAGKKGMLDVELLV